MEAELVVLAARGLSNCGSVQIRRRRLMCTVIKPIVGAREEGHIVARLAVAAWLFWRLQSQTLIGST